MTGFYAGNVLLAKIAVVPYRAHLSGFDEVRRRGETIDLEPDGDTSVLLMAEPAAPVSELATGIDGGWTKVEQGDTIEAPAQGVSIVIASDCDLAAPQYALKAVRAGRVPQASVECPPKGLRQSRIVHGCRFLPSKDARGHGGRRLIRVSQMGVLTARVTCVLFRGELNPVPGCRRPVRGGELIRILRIGEPVLKKLTGSAG